MTTTPEQFVNFATSTIAHGAGGVGTALQAADTSVALKSGDGAQFPARAPFRVLIGTVGGAHEIALCTAISGDILTLTRAQEGTTAPTTWGIGAAIGQYTTAGSLKSLWTASPQVYNVMGYGAVGDGVTDDTTAIQAALNATPAGGICLLPATTHATSAPLLIPPQVTLMGQRVAHLDSAAGSVIKPLASFSGAAVILFVDQTTGGYSVANTEPRLSHITLDGANLSGTTIDGVQTQGYVHGGVLEDVQIRTMPNHGLAQVSNASGHAYSWRFIRAVANGCGNHGFSFVSTDNTWLDCEAINNAKSGWYLGGSVPNCHFTNCRAEWNGNDGFTLAGAWAAGAGSGGCLFTSCSTDRNANNGVSITATGNTPVVFSGLMLRRDGRNGGSGGGGYAGLHCAGSTIPVVVNGLTVFPGVDDNGTNTNSPQYGVVVGASSANVVLGSGYVQGASTGIYDDGSNANCYRSPNILEATGTTSSPAYVASTLTTTASQTVNNHLDTVGRALGIVHPRDHGIAAWSFDPANVSSGKAGTAGTVYLAAVYVNRNVTVSKIFWGINTAGATPTAGQNYVGLYNSSGTLLASAGVDASVTGTGMFTASITSQSLTPGLYWVAFLFNAATMPQVYRGQDLNASVMNVGISAAASYRFCTNGTGQTALPASIAPASNVIAQFSYWAAIG